MEDIGNAGGSPSPPVCKSMRFVFGVTLSAPDMCV